MDPANLRTLLNIVNSQPAPPRRPTPPPPAQPNPQAQRAILGRMVLLQLAAKAAAAKQAQAPGRVIQPAPSAPPVVTALPHVGTGPVAPAAPAVQPQVVDVPGGPGELVQQPPQQPQPPAQNDPVGSALGTVAGPVGGALGGIGGFLGEKAGGAISNVAQAGPVAAIGSTPVAQAAGSILSTVLTAPQAAVISDQGQDMYDFVSGKHDAATVAVDMNIPFRRKLFEWAAAHPEQVKDAYENGYVSRDGQERWTGGRAVWEAYARANLTGNLEGAIVGTITDPWNALPAVGKLGEGLKGAGVAMKGAAELDAATALLRTPGPTAGATLGDDLARKAILELGSGDAARVDQVLRDISPEMADAFAAGNFTLASFPQALEPLGQAWATKQATKLAAANPGLMRLGSAIEKTGHAIEFPAKMIDEFPAKAVGKARSVLIDPMLSKAARSRIGASIGRFFETSPQARALRAANQVIAARMQKQHALERERRIRSMFTPQQANLLFGPPGPASAQVATPTFAQVLNPTQINLAGQAVPVTVPGAGPATVATVAETRPSGTLRLGGNPDELTLHNPLVTDLSPPDQRGRIESAPPLVRTPEAAAPPTTVPDAGTVEPPAAAAVTTPDVTAPAPPPTTRTLPTEPAVPYVERFSDPKAANTAKAGDRARERLSALAAVHPDAAPEINGIMDDLMAERDDILSTSGQGDRVRDATNRVDLWFEEFDAERRAREVLKAHGLPEPSYVNTQAGTMARALDTLAWNPDPAAAEAARAQLEGVIRRSEKGSVAPAIRNAMQDAEDFRATLPTPEARQPGEIVNPQRATEPATNTPIRVATQRLQVDPDIAERVRSGEITTQEAVHLQAQRGTPQAAPTVGTPRGPVENSSREHARASFTGSYEMAGYEPKAVSEIRTDPGRFQPRGGISSEVADQLAREWDWKRYDPITVWRDPGDGNDYVLAGHHRLAGAQTRGITELDTRRFSGSEGEAIEYARTSNNQRPESPLERSNTIRRLYDEKVGDVPLSPADETRVLASLTIPGVKPSERPALLNLSRLPVAIRDDIAVHPNMGKANLSAHAKLGERIDPLRRPRGDVQTVTAAEAESVYRAVQKQKPKLPDGSPRPMSAEDVTRVVEGIDAMVGMPAQEQMGMFAGMATDDGRAADFLATMAEMTKHHKLLKTREAAHAKSLKILEDDLSTVQSQLDALPENDPQVGELQARGAELQQHRDGMLNEVDRYRLALEDAQKQAGRMAENNLRADDFRDYRANSYVLPVKPVIDAIKAGGDTFRMVGDWRDEVATRRAATVAENTAQTEALKAEKNAAPGVATGPIVAPEVDDVLGQTFSDKNVAYQGRTFGEVADEIDARVVAEKNRLIQLIGQPTSLLSAKDAAELKRLRAAYPHVRTLGDATKINTDNIFRRELHRAMQENEGVRDATRVGRFLDRASTMYSALNLLAPWSVGRYYVGNLTGDSWQILLADGPVALAAASDLRLLKAMTEYAYRGGDPLVGALGDLVKDSGLAGFHPQLMDETMASAILPSQRTAIRRAGGTAKYNAVGDALASNWNPVNIARNAVNGMEWAHRTGLWGHHFRHNLILARKEFADEMVDTALRHSVTGEEVHQAMDFLMAPVADGAEVADTFARIAYARGVKYDDAANFGKEMGRKWQSKVYKADEAARSRVEKTLFSYEQRNADVWLRRFVPFHWWLSRAIPFYAEQMIRHPGFTAAYYRIFQATKEEAAANGWPNSLQNYLKVWEGPGGIMMLLNPLAAMGVLDNFVEADGGYTDENVSAIGKVLNGASNFGISLLPWWGSMLNHLGYMGQSPLSLDPVGTSQARRFLGGILQFAAGEGWLGENAQTLTSKPYEQALMDVREHLSGIAPGSYHIDQTDPNALPAVQIRNVMLRDYLGSLNMDINAYLALGAAAQADPASPEAQKLDAINGRIAADELDSGPLYRSAVREWSESNAFVLGVNAIVPGPKRTRQEDSLYMQSLANALGAPTAFREDAPDAVSGLGVLPARTSTGELSDPTFTVGISRGDTEFVRRWQEKFGTEFHEGDIERMRDAAKLANQEQNASPQAAILMGQQAAYYAIGSEKGRSRLDVYNAIAFNTGGHDVNIPSQDVHLSAAQVRGLNSDTRRTLADAWLADRDDDQSAARAREVRGIYEDTHPELGAYRAWSRDTRTQWGSPGAFRNAAVKANANYAAWVEREMNRMRLENMTPSQMQEQMDRNTFGMDAYMAYMGIPSSRYDPTPKSTGAPLPVASEGAPLGAMGGGSSGYGYQDWAGRVNKAIRETDAALRAAKDYTGVNMLNVPEDVRKGVMAQPGFPPEGQLPSDAWIYEDYITFWREQQAAGGDSSIQAFIDSTRKPDATQTHDYQAATWPPVPAG